MQPGRRDGLVVASEATFDSRCAWCDEMIREGDPIETDDGEWGHAECVETVREELQNEAQAQAMEP